MFINYLKTAYRHLNQHRLHSLINIGGLSLGITCAMVIAIFIQYESGFDRFHKKASVTYRVVQHTRFPDQVLHWGTTCYPMAEALRNDFGDFAHVTQASGPHTRFFTADRGNEKIAFEDRFVLFVDTAYARVFDLRWLAGNRAEALTLKNSVVLTEQTAQRAFGSMDYAAVLGKTIMLNGKDPLTVTGVIEDAPGNINLRYNLLVPYAFFKENNPYPASNWAGNYRGTTFVALHENGKRAEIEQRISGWKGKYLRPEDDARISYELQPIGEIHNDTLYETTPESYVMPGKVLKAAGFVAIIILVLAAVNFVNLTTARSATRSREVGIRKVMGGTRRSLIVQFVSEHSLIVVLTMLLSLGLSQLAIDQLNGYLTVINMKLSFTWTHVALLMAIGAAVVLIAAVYPAVVMASFRTIEAVRNSSVSPASGGYTFRRVLIVLQFATVQALLIATIVVAVQIHHFNSTELGFQSESMLSVGIPSEDSREALRNRLMENASVEAVTFGSSAPITVDAGYGTSYWTPQQSELESQEALMYDIDTSYLSFFQIDLVAGRNVTSSDRFQEFIVNEKLVRSLGWTPDQALGRKLKINEGEATIVGVVSNFHNQSLKSEILPAILMNGKELLNRAYVRFRNPVPGTIAEVESVWKEFAPGKVFGYTMIADAIEMQYGLETMVFHGFTLFSALAIAIGCLGLFGLSSLMAIRRAKEIGIRKVLGASVQQIVSRFSREFLWMVAIGFLFAVPCATWFMSRWLEGFVYRIQLQWWMFGLGGLLALLIAMATVSFHSVKAGLANPVDSLKNE